MVDGSCPGAEVCCCTQLWEAPEESGQKHLLVHDGCQVMPRAAVRKVKLM